MSELIEKSRRINSLLQRTGGRPVDFSEMADVLNEAINSNIYIASRKGKILGHSFLEDFTCDTMEKIVNEDGYFPEDYNQELLTIRDINRNIEMEEEDCLFIDDESCIFDDKLSTVVPIFGGGDRLGTLVLTRFGEEFTDQDLFLAEYGAAVIGMEIMRSKNERMEKEIREKTAVQIAIDSLSFSETEAIKSIFDELDGKEGILVTSKIGDEMGITRSTIVNALRKLESSGMLESRSLGMKGTYIKILNDHILAEIEKV